MTLLLNPRINMKVFIVGGGFQYIQLFDTLGYSGCRTIEEADIVVFTGGEDVSPSLYGEGTLAKTHSNKHRDDYEVDCFKRCRDRDIPMVGICRGGQFLNVMSGGKLYQHVNGHTGDHEAFTVATGANNGVPKSIMVTSTHHQMMIPGEGAVLLLTAQEANEKHRFGSIEEGIAIDPEVIIYPDTDCLCFQPHPEFATARPELVDFFEECLEDWIEPMVVMQQEKVVSPSPLKGL